MTIAKQLVVVTCEDSGHEALYADGVLVEQDDTIYATDIAACADGRPVYFSHVLVVMDAEEYPGELGQCRPWAHGELPEPNKVEEKEQAYEYYVLSGSTFIGFHELPEDAFDDLDDTLYRRVSYHDAMALHPGYGRRIDEVVRMCPEVEDPTIDDGFQLQLDTTVGWLRSISVLAGHLQGISRVRNPEYRRPEFRGPVEGDG